MADKKKPIIVIKKIKKNAEGHHGGSWKVAFADFMTAMMAFFLVMWLVSQSEDVKKEIADYFSTPSVVEYNFKNYGALLTLEKLFLDLVSDPLKFFESFIRPADYTPDIMNLGSEKVTQHHIMEQIGDFSDNIQTSSNSISFDIPDHHLFEKGTSKMEKRFIKIISQIQALTTGLKDSTIQIYSQIHFKSLPETYQNRTKEEKTFILQNTAEERMHLISKAIQKTLEHPSVDIYGKASVFESNEEEESSGSHLQDSYSRWIRIEIRKKEKIEDSSKEKPHSPSVNKGFKESPSAPSSLIYKKFVKKLTQPTFSSTEESSGSEPLKEKKDQTKGLHGGRDSFSHSGEENQEQKMDLEALRKKSLENRKAGARNFNNIDFDPFQKDPFENSEDHLDIHQEK